MAPIRYAFNISRQSFISLGVQVADTPFTRLRGLIGKMRIRSDEALWVVPSRGIHTVGLLFPVDVIYLDSRMRVVHLIEGLRPLRFAALRRHSASVLELPIRSIYNSGTQVGDQIVVALPGDIEKYVVKEEPEVEPKRQVG